MELIPHSGLVRITFDRSVATTAVTDAVLDGGLAERAFVVRGLDGRILVDVHLSTGATGVRVWEDRGALTVEIWDDGKPAPRLPEVSKFVVVTSPTTREVEYPFVVTGYARMFEANVIGEIILPDGGREVVAVTSAADYIEMWGEFRLEITGGPTGLITLFVGAYPPIEDALREGVELELVVG